MGNWNEFTIHAYALNIWEAFLKLFGSVYFRFGCHSDDSNILSEMNAKHPCSWLEQTDYKIWMNNQKKGFLVT